MDTGSESTESVSKTDLVGKATSSKKGKNPIDLRPCEVCGAKSSGFHFGAITCEACKSFFRRTMTRNLTYSCFGSGGPMNKCHIRLTKGGSSPCPACRMEKCGELNMSLSASKKGRYTHERRAKAIDVSRTYWSNTIKSETPDQSHIQGEGQTQEQVISSQGDQESLATFQVAATSSQIHTVGPEVLSPQGTTSPQDHVQGHQVLQGHLEGRQDQLLTPIEGSELLHSISYTLNSQCGSQAVLSPAPSNTSSSSVQSPAPSGLSDLMTTFPGTSADNQRQLSEAMQIDTQMLCSLAPTSTSETFTQEPMSSMTPLSLTDDLITFPVVQDIGDLSKLLTEEVSDEDELKKIIDDTITAFDKENFINKGFLSKAAAAQCKYLKERDESIKIFGGQLPLVSEEEYSKVLQETGIEMDGRLAVLRNMISAIEPFILQVRNYYSNIPGFSTLPKEDQIALMYSTKLEQMTTITFPLHNVDEGLVVPPRSDGHTVVDMRYMGIFHGQQLMQDVLDLVRKIQELQLTDHEYALLSAVCLMQPNACVTDSGSLKCSLIQDRLRKAQEKLLSRRMDSAKVGQVMLDIKLIELKLQKTSPKMRESWRKVRAKFKDKVEFSSFALQWFE